MEQLEPITEVVQLLQVNKKNMSDVDGIIAIVSKLNAAQVRTIFRLRFYGIIVSLYCTFL